MKRRLVLKLFFILLLASGAAYVDSPYAKGFKTKLIERDLKIHRGLDLAGGSRLIYEADLSQIGNRDPDEAVEGVLGVIDRRINALGVTEPLLQTTQIGDKKGVVVELPGIKDVQEAIDLIGRTAKLEFFEQTEEGFTATELTGADLVKASLQVETASTRSLSQTRLRPEPVVAIKFNEDGTKKFAAITSRNVNKPLPIIIDGQVISAPTVQTSIVNGEAVITGVSDIKFARQLAIALQAGALPVPINLVAQSTIGPTLGQISVQKSILAGAVGILAIMGFMVAYYRAVGLVASIALIIYALIVFALFKLIPVTLTLAGITAFILSIGMAVDANILIFERLKEERRKGKPMAIAIDEGFGRAWSSIRDSNVSSVITAIILFIFGSSLIRGFAVVLIIGILVSMFTAITLSRNLLKLVTRQNQ